MGNTGHASLTLFCRQPINIRPGIGSYYTCRTVIGTDSALDASFSDEIWFKGCIFFRPGKEVELPGNIFRNQILGCPNAMDTKAAGFFQIRFIRSSNCYGYDVGIGMLADKCACRDNTETIMSKYLHQMVEGDAIVSVAIDNNRTACLIISANWL